MNLDMNTKTTDTNGKLENEKIISEGYRIGNVLIRNYTKDARNAVEFSNRVDILRYAACTILGVDLANAQRELQFTQEQTEAHIGGLIETVVQVCETVTERIDAGETKRVWIPT